ncbi:MAG TPA: hypothetical protein VFE47_08995 [Tepidisphaeraceae bacterium]|jgi:hypothetical protein|nr:hypothetical protein [Tepidisphaeraceae bacterium]
MAKAKKLKPSAVPKYFNDLLSDAGVTPTSADLRAVLAAFKLYCRTPIECNSELMIFEAYDSHHFDWSSQPHEFTVCLTRGFYKAGKVSDTAYTSKVRLTFPSTAASQKINITRELESVPSVGGYNQGDFENFFHEIENDARLWKWLATAQLKAVATYAGMR